MHERKKGDPGKIAIQHEGGGRHEESNPTGCATSSPKLRAGGHGEKDELGVVLAVIHGEHRKRSNGSQSEPGRCGRRPRPERDESPDQNKWRTNQIAGQVICVGIRPEETRDGLKVCENQRPMTSAGIVHASAAVKEVKCRGNRARPMRRNMRDPERCWKAEGREDGKCLQGASAIDSPG